MNKERVYKILEQEQVSAERKYSSNDRYRSVDDWIKLITTYVLKASEGVTDIEKIVGIRKVLAIGLSMCKHKDIPSRTPIPEDFKFILQKKEYMWKSEKYTIPALTREEAAEKARGLMRGRNIGITPIIDESSLVTDLISPIDNGGYATITLQDDQWNLIADNSIPPSSRLDDFATPPNSHLRQGLADNVSDPYASPSELIRRAPSSSLGIRDSAMEARRPTLTTETGVRMYIEDHRSVNPGPMASSESISFSGRPYDYDSISEEEGHPHLIVGSPGELSSPSELIL